MCRTDALCGCWLPWPIPGGGTRGVPPRASRVSLLWRHLTHIQHIDAAFGNQCALYRDDLAHVIHQNSLGGLVVLHAGQHVDLATLLEQANRVPQLGAGRGAGLVAGSVVAPLVVAPHVDE